MVKLVQLRAEEFAPIVADAGVELGELQVVDPAPPPPSENKPLPALRKAPFLLGPIGAGLDIAAACRLYRQRGEKALPAGAPALLYLKDARPDEELARWRNHLWPWLHLSALYRVAGGRAERETLHGREGLAGECARPGVVLLGRNRRDALSPRTTVEKFDANARRLEPAARRARARALPLDAALGGRARAAAAGSAHPGLRLRRGLDRDRGGAARGRREPAGFDPSPEMVRAAEANAREAGVDRLRGAHGLRRGPAVPGDGEPPFDLVLSSGVISFAPDLERWLDGLCARGRARRHARRRRHEPALARHAPRRATRPLLPAREMNALPAEEVRAALSARGFRSSARPATSSRAPCRSSRTSPTRGWAARCRGRSCGSTPRRPGGSARTRSTRGPSLPAPLDVRSQEKISTIRPAARRCPMLCRRIVEIFS